MLPGKFLGTLPGRLPHFFSKASSNASRETSLNLEGFPEGFAEGFPKCFLERFPGGFPECFPRGFLEA
jgi:hypothetical protein